MQVDFFKLAALLDFCKVVVYCYDVQEKRARENCKMDISGSRQLVTLFPKRLLQDRPYLLNRLSDFLDIAHFRNTLKYATRMCKYIYKISSIEVWKKGPKATSDQNLDIPKQ